MTRLPYEPPTVEPVIATPPASAERIAACYRALDDGRITRTGTASLLECTSRESVVRRAARLLERGYRLVDVEQALVAWADLHGAVA